MLSEMGWTATLISGVSLEPFGINLHEKIEGDLFSRFMGPQLYDGFRVF